MPTVWAICLVVDCKMSADAHGFKYATVASDQPVGALSGLLLCCRHDESESSIPGPVRTTTSVAQKKGGNIWPQLSSHSQPSSPESSDLRVIELGDKTGQTDISTVHLSSTRMRLFQTPTANGLRITSLTCDVLGLSRNLFPPFGQAPFEVYLLYRLVFRDVASEHVLGLCHKLPTTLCTQVTEVPKRHLRP